jgi:hypothetical protein
MVKMKKELEEMIEKLRFLSGGFLQASVISNNNPIDHKEADENYMSHIHLLTAVEALEKVKDKL